LEELIDERPETTTQYENRRGRRLVPASSRDPRDTAVVHSRSFYRVAYSPIATLFARSTKNKIR
jgi:hypothetical protein